jgi:phosphoribosylamine-glycine ligase
MERIIWPTVKGMAAEGNTYTGFLYAGLMIDKQGNRRLSSSTAASAIRKPSRSCCA